MILLAASLSLAILAVGIALGVKSYLVSRRVPERIQSTVQIGNQIWVWK